MARDNCPNKIVWLGYAASFMFFVYNGGEKKALPSPSEGFLRGRNVGMRKLSGAVTLSSQIAEASVITGKVCQV